MKQPEGKKGVGPKPEISEDSQPIEPQEVEMYIRNIRIKLKANSVPEFTRLLEKEIIPLLRKQKGFQDEISFVAPERNEAVAISFWDKQDSAEAYNHAAYLDVLRLLSKVAAGMPIMDTFEVGTSTFGRMTASAV